MKKISKFRRFWRNLLRDLVYYVTDVPKDTKYPRCITCDANKECGQQFDCPVLNDNTKHLKVRDDLIHR